MKCERCLEWVTIKPESREGELRACESCSAEWHTLGRHKACPECGSSSTHRIDPAKPQAAADSFDEEFRKWKDENISTYIRVAPMWYQNEYIEKAARWGYSQGVARMQSEIANWKQLHDNNEACINNQHDRISALERERDELKCKLDESLELISQMRAQWFGSWAMNKCISMLRGTRFKHPEHEDPFWLQRIGGGK